MNAPLALITRSLFIFDLLPPSKRRLCNRWNLFLGLLVCSFVRLLVSRISEKLLRGFASNFHSMCISSMARCHLKMVTFCLFVCLLLRKEKPILAHTFQWAAALKWVAAQANTPLPSLFSFTVTVFFSWRINFGYSQEYMVWAKFYCSLIFPQIQP